MIDGRDITRSFLWWIMQSYPLQWRSCGALVMMEYGNRAIRVLYVCCMCVVCVLYACCMRVVCVLYACCMCTVDLYNDACWIFSDYYVPLKLSYFVARTSHFVASTQSISHENCNLEQVFTISVNFLCWSIYYRQRVCCQYQCEIGRAHVWTPVTSAHLVCRLLLEKKKKKKQHTPPPPPPLPPLPLHVTI